ncbi:MAG: chemotaxis protein CheA, partial [Oligoflexales bacterium]|nr:chemotaxis protein CheA [Oligoflexales bacterium]
DTIYRKSDDLFKEIFGGVGTLSRDLKKENPDIEIKCENFNVTEHGGELLRNIFVHIIRNSMDHGIESAEERISAGKKPAGKICLTLDRVDSHAVIRYKDDGRGINISRLRDIAGKMGFLKEEEMKDPYKVVNIIFHEGVSTSKSVTEISGRGVGMGAIKEYVEKDGGRIELKLLDLPKERQSFVPFEIELSMPVAILVA